MRHTLEYYRILQGTNGVSNMKEAKVRAFRQEVQDAFEKTINWETVDINRGSRSQELEVVGTNDMMTKKVKARPGEIIRLGDLVSWRNTYWLVNTLDADGQINYQGTMVQCNYILRWQLEDGSIYEELGWSKDASKYSFGETRNDYMDVAQFNVKVIVQINDKSLTISRNKRFLIGAYGEGRHPLAMEVSRINPITNYYVYDTRDDMFQSGLLEITLHEAQFDALRDNVALGVADYRSYEENQEREEAADIPAVESGWFG